MEAVGVPSRIKSELSGSRDPGNTLSLHYYYENLHLFHLVFHIVIAAVPIFGGPFVPLCPKTALLTFILYWMGSIGITAGYHRLWTHRSYSAGFPLRIFLAIFGASQLQWSIAWWARHHRAHHCYLDTDKDPYDARKGFFFTHIGWLIGHTPEKWGKVYTLDLQQDQVVLWQQKYYIIIALGSCFALPTLIAYYGWNDWQGGLVHAGFVRVFLYQQVTYLVNSLNHSRWAGLQPYSNEHSAVNNLLTGILASGEGYHNFHHTFPTDFRNGVEWYEVDLSKYMIWLWCWLGLAKNPIRVSKFEIERAQQRLQKSNSAEGKRYVDEAYRPFSQLPTMRKSEFILQSKTGRCLVCMDGVIYDIGSFMTEHPGGQDLLHGVLGDDGTAAFYHGFHDHSPQARRILATMRTAILEEG